VSRSAILTDSLRRSLLIRADCGRVREDSGEGGRMVDCAVGCRLDPAVEGVVAGGLLSSTFLLSSPKKRLFLGSFSSVTPASPSLCSADMSGIVESCGVTGRCTASGGMAASAVSVTRNRLAAYVVLLRRKQASRFLMAAPLPLTISLANSVHWSAVAPGNLS
jgi:hypothetical protein